MEAEPGSRMSMPLEIEAVAANPVQASERRVEFFAEVLWLAGAITLDEPIAVSMPFAEYIDWVVELSGADCRQESRLQHLVDKPPTCDRDDGLFRIRQTRVSTFRCQAATFLGSVVFRQFQGSSSSSRYWMLGDAGEYVGEPGQRIDVIELCRRDQCRHGRS